MNRATIKNLMPSSLKTALMNVRDHLNGPGIEYDVVQDYVFAADDSVVPRINFVIPQLSSDVLFGGVATGLNFFDGLDKLLAQSGVDARIVTEKRIDGTDDLVGRYRHPTAPKLYSLAAHGNVLPTRSGDIFVVFNWWVSLNLEAVLAAQAKHFRQPQLPKIYLFQDYEPHFYPFSAAHLLAREAMGERWPTWAIFNTGELRDFCLAEGHRAEKTYVFEPRMNSGLRPFANDLRAAEKRRTILVYGRPQIARNAFFLIERGLEHWARSYGERHRDWRFVSAGTAHANLELGGGHRLISVGKLGLDAYGMLLRETAIGLSLMASPHPSYPPLEMTHFGARVLTNGYARRRPADRHDNLVELPGLRPADIAEALETEITLFEKDPVIGFRGKSHMPKYMDEDCIECLEDLVADLLAELRSRSIRAA